MVVAKKVTQRLIQNDDGQLSFHCYPEDAAAADDVDTSDPASGDESSSPTKQCPF